MMKFSEPEALLPTLDLISSSFNSFTSSKHIYL